MVFPLQGGQLILIGGLVSCHCCGLVETYELAIKYGWEGTGMEDLDTKTVFLSEQVGWSCGGSGTYVQWLAGGSGSQDDTSVNGFERVDVRVDASKLAGLWTSSVNIELYAGWYSPRGGSGEAVVTVRYNGGVQGKAINPGSQSGCASTPVGIITVYANGTFDLV